MRITVVYIILTLLKYFLITYNKSYINYNILMATTIMNSKTFNNNQEQNDSIASQALQMDLEKIKSFM
jgi:hypothetical protein